MVKTQNTTAAAVAVVRRPQRPPQHYRSTFQHQGGQQHKGGQHRGGQQQYRGGQQYRRSYQQNHGRHGNGICKHCGFNIARSHSKNNECPAKNSNCNFCNKRHKHPTS